MFKLKKKNQGVFGIDVYENHKWDTMVVFKKRWQAILFHILTMKSVDHQARRTF